MKTTSTYLYTYIYYDDFSSLCSFNAFSILVMGVKHGQTPQRCNSASQLRHRCWMRRCRRLPGWARWRGHGDVRGGTAAHGFHLGTSWNILELRGYQGQNGVQSISWHGKNGIAKMEGIYMRQWRIILGIFLAIAFYGSIHLVGGILDPFQRRGIEFG